MCVGWWVVDGISPSSRIRHFMTRVEYATFIKSLFLSQHLKLHKTQVTRPTSPRVQELHRQNQEITDCQVAQTAKVLK